IRNQGRLHAAEVTTDALTDDPRNGIGDQNSTDVRVSAVPELLFQKTVLDENGAPVGPGDRLTYSLHIRNTGLSYAFNVHVTDPLDPTLDEVVPASGGVVSGGVIEWTVPQIATGEEVVLTFRARVHSPTPNGTRIANQGRLTANALQRPLLSDDPGTP